MACGCQASGGWVVFVLVLGVAFAGRLSVDDMLDNNLTSEFVCPSECQECCTAHSWDIGIAAWGVSKSKYKCILKSSTTPSADCEEAETRTYSKQKKTKCEFRATELESKPWKDLEKTPCSKHTRCCCNSQDDWTENKCFDKQTSETYVRRPSQDSRANGQEQTYEKRRQTYANPGTCLGVKAKEYQKGPEKAFSTHNRCCIKTKKKYEMRKVNCRMEGHLCDELEMQHQLGGNTWCEEEVCDHKKFWWTDCQEYEPLYHCSKTGSEHEQSGMLYKRISTAQGMCIGDQSTPENLQRIHGSGQYEGLKLSTKNTCPEGFSTRVTGHKCKCSDACG